MRRGSNFERRRCQGTARTAGVTCGRTLVMGGPRQSGVYYTDQLDRRALCWDCYDVARGNVPTRRYERSKARS